MSLTLVVRKAIIDDIISQKGEVYKAFQNYLVQGCFKYLHKSYTARSYAKADIFGFSWDKTKGYKKGKKRIMVDTGRAIDSYKPAEAVDGVYTPINEDQLVKITKYKITLGSSIKYLKFTKRIIIPQSMVDPVMRLAIPYAIKMITPRLEALIKKSVKK
jgi:hypothetical protein